MHDNPSVVSIHGFSNVRNVGADVILTSSALETIDGFQRVTNVGGNVRIANHNALLHVNDTFPRYAVRVEPLRLLMFYGHHRLTNVGGIEIEGNGAMKSINGFNAYVCVVFLSTNRITLFHRIVSVFGDVDIQRNNAVMEINGFQRYLTYHKLSIVTQLCQSHQCGR